MILKYGIVVSDVDELLFFVVGPFDSKQEAREFQSEIAQCNILTSIHPHIQLTNWMRRVVNAPKAHRHHVELAAMQELRDIS